MVVVGKVDCRCYGWRLLSRLIVVVNCWWRTWVVKSTCHPSIAIPTYVFSAETNKNFTKIEDMKTPLHNLRGCFLRNCLFVMVLVCSGCFLHQPRPRIYFEYWQIPNVGTSISLGLPHFTLNHHLKLPRKTVQPPKPNHFSKLSSTCVSLRNCCHWYLFWQECSDLGGAPHQPAPVATKKPAMLGETCGWFTVGCLYFVVGGVPSTHMFAAKDTRLVCPHSWIAKALFAGFSSWWLWEM